MNAETQLTELEGAARALGIKVVYDTLAGETTVAGGLCKIKGEWRVIADRRAPAGEKVAVLARALAGFDLEGVFLSPQVREMVGRMQKPEPEATT